MGTHPIFESDFDCLTERQKKPKIRTKIELVNGVTAGKAALEIFRREGEQNRAEKIVRNRKSEMHLYDRLYSSSGMYCVLIMMYFLFLTMTANFYILLVVMRLTDEEEVYEKL